MAGSTPRAATGSPPAELDRRLHALVLDRLVVWGTYAVAGTLAWRLLLERGRTAAGVVALVAVVLLVPLVLALLLGRRGATPGKAVLGLRVLDERTGRPIGVAAALLRTLVLGAATLPTAGLGLAVLAWTAMTDASGRRRGAHDRLTHAVVLDVRAGPAAEETVASAPRHVVNLTALRLVPVPAAPPPDASPPLHGGPPDGERTDVRGAGRGPVGWRVSFDSGESLVLEGPALLGRRPEPREGEPVRHLVALRSSDMSLSKTHAQLQVAPDGALVVMDRGSTNGSSLVRGGVSRSLTVGRPATLVEGDEVRLGDRRMRVDHEV